MRIISLRATLTSLISTHLSSPNLPDHRHRISGISRRILQILNSPRSLLLPHIQYLTPACIAVIRGRLRRRWWAGPVPNAGATPLPVPDTNPSHLVARNTVMKYEPVIYSSPISSISHLPVLRSYVDDSEGDGGRIMPELRGQPLCYSHSSPGPRTPNHH